MTRDRAIHALAALAVLFALSGIAGLAFVGFVGSSPWFAGALILAAIVREDCRARAAIPVRLVPVVADRAPGFLWCDGAR